MPLTRTLLGTALAATLTVTATVHGQSPKQEKIATVPASAKKDAYAFATFVVEGMSGYIDAEETLATLSQNPRGMTGVVNGLAATRTAEAKWRLAAGHLKSFRTSKDAVLADVARQLGDAYMMMSELYGQRVALLEAILKNTISSSADIAIEESKLQSKSDQVFDLVGIATAAVANCMIDLSRTDAEGHARYLKLTLEEKTDVTDRLMKLAGPSPEDETIDNGRSFARAPALVLWRWFRSGWYSADEK